MVFIHKTDNPDIFRLEAEFSSWYSLKTFISAREAAYLDTLQNVFNVEDALGEWIPLRLTNHQVEFHLDDVILKQSNAPIRVIQKSRNTSLTTDSSISDIMAQAEFSNPVLPYVRMNSRSVNHLIQQVKQTIKHIKPVIFEEADESKRISPEIDPPKRKVYYPFNPAEVNMKATGSITFPNGTALTGFPANSDASETIRGLRLRGNFGFLDEVNFMRLFKNVFVAMRDASAGSKNKKKIQQFTIGSTLKGETPFSIWLDSIKKSGAKKIKIYDWPVFRRDLFQPYLDGKCVIPFHENPKLISIVHWHDKEELWELWKQDQHVFKEEYMAIKVESDEQFYPTSLIIASCDIEDSLILEELPSWLDKYVEIRIGFDPASINDYFGITIFGKLADGHIEQLFVEGIRSTPLPIMQKYCDNLLRIINNHHDNWLCSLDSTPIGLQLTQFLKDKYGEKNVRGLNGNMSIATTDDNKVKLNPYMHTYLKKSMYDGILHLCADELQITHFQAWDYAFNAESGAKGHGDLTMSCIYALCPRDLQHTEKAKLKYSRKDKGKTDADKYQIELLRKFKKRIHKR